MASKIFKTLFIKRAHRVGRGKSLFLLLSTEKEPRRRIHPHLSASNVLEAENDSPGWSK